MDDAFRGRIFSLYDVLFNVAFVGAAAVAALILPPDGESAAVVIAVAALYAIVAVTMFRWSRVRQSALACHRMRPAPALDTVHGGPPGSARRTRGASVEGRCFT